MRTYQLQSRHCSLIDSRRLDNPAGSCNAINMTSGQNEEPPPLPMKKKHSKFSNYTKNYAKTFTLYISTLYMVYTVHFSFYYYVTLT